MLGTRLYSIMFQPVKEGLIYTNVQRNFDSNLNIFSHENQKYMCQVSPTANFTSNER